MKLKHLFESAQVGKYKIPTMSIVLNRESLQKKRFEEAIVSLENYLREGELIKTEFTTLKQSINSVFDKIWELSIEAPYFHNGKYANLPEDVNEILNWNINTPQVHTVNGALKKLKKIKSKNHPAAITANKLINEFILIANDVNSLKNKVVVKKRVQVEKEQTEQKAKSRMLSHDDVKKVKGILDKLSSVLRPDAEKRVTKDVMGYIDRWQSQYDGTRKTEPYQFYKTNSYAYHYVSRAIDLNTYKLKSDYKSIIAKEVKKEIDGMLGQFVEKNTNKLMTIVSHKGNLENVKLEGATSSGVVEGQMYFTFKDKSSFRVQNRIVSSTSKNGYPFYRFPTTFHDVKMPDGSKMKQPSEENMNRNFI